MSSKKYKGRKYEVFPYDKNWVKLFEDEAKKVKEIFGDCLFGVEHVGSTAIPGMAGKPTIDILVLINDLSCADAAVSEMEKLGYVSKKEYVAAGSHLFAKQKNGHALSNVHVFKPEHPHVKDMLMFRDFLRENPKEANDYGALKLRLFEKYPGDYGMYRKEKNEYLERLTAKVVGVKIIEPNKEILGKQKDCIRKLKETFPDELVEAVGSMAVPMTGRSEIDIMIVADKNRHAAISDTLANWGYGKGPVIDGIAYLRKFEEGIEIGIQILPLDHKMIAIHRKILERLRADEKMRHDYSEFKRSLDGQTEEDYKSKKEDWIRENILK